MTNVRKWSGAGIADGEIGAELPTFDPKPG